MQFIKFNSLKNHYDSLIKKVACNLASDQFMVTEKIDGANASYYIPYDESLTSRYASRLEFKDNVDMNGNHHKAMFENFEHHQELRNIFIHYLNKLNITDNDKKDCYGVFFGELFGGKIQKPHPYGARLKFIVYDFCIASPNLELKIGDDFVNSIREDLNLIYPKDKYTFLRIIPEQLRIKILFVGNFLDAIEYNQEFKSNYISDEHTDSEDERLLSAEGIVIEPTDINFFGKSRIYIKKKSKYFTEKESVKPIRVDKILTENQQVLLDMLMSYVNNNRFSSLVSKLSEDLELNQIPRYAGMLVQDILQDIMNERDIDLKKSDDYKIISKNFSKKVVEFVRNYLLSNI